VRRAQALVVFREQGSGKNVRRAMPRFTHAGDGGGSGHLWLLTVGGAVADADWSDHEVSREYPRRYGVPDRVCAGRLFDSDAKAEVEKILKGMLRKVWSEGDHLCVTSPYEPST